MSVDSLMMGGVSKAAIAQAIRWFSAYRVVFQRVALVFGVFCSTRVDGAATYQSPL
jgi:hypothetical protein